MSLESTSREMLFRKIGELTARIARLEKENVENRVISENGARQEQRRSNRLLGIASKLRETMQCNCNLDKWEPERSTGHSFVCRIHKAAIKVARARKSNES